MAIESFQQYGPLTAAYLGGAGSSWAFFIKYLLPREMKAMAVEIEALKKQNEKLTADVEEYHALMKQALSEKLEEADESGT